MPPKGGIVACIGENRTSSELAPIREQSLQWDYSDKSDKYTTIRSNGEESDVSTRKREESDISWRKGTRTPESDKSPPDAEIGRIAPPRDFLGIMGMMGDLSEESPCNRCRRMR